MRSRPAAACAVLLLATMPLAADSTAVSELAVRDAIAEAVAARLGPGATVRVEALHVSLLQRPPAGRLHAFPHVGSRLGQPIRLALRWSDGKPAGEAGCVVRAEMAHLRARRDLRRGQALVPADVETVQGQVDGVPLRPLPLEVEGARTLRAVASGAVLVPAALAIPPLVRSGDTVVTRVRVGGLEVRGRGLASQNGDRGDVIRVVNPDSGRALSARVVGRGEVEVVHGS